MRNLIALLSVDRRLWMATRLFHSSGLPLFNDFRTISQVGNGCSFRAFITVSESFRPTKMTTASASASSDLIVRFRMEMGISGFATDMFLQVGLYFVRHAISPGIFSNFANEKADFSILTLAETVG